jgi:hypothetical protein
VDFKPKVVRRDKEGYFILIKEVIHQEEIIIIYLYVPSADQPDLIKHTLKDIKSQSPKQW